MNFTPYTLHRGEKLYVNKTTSEPRVWRKVICWTLTLLLLAGAVTVAVLIGGKIHGHIEYMF